jgi:uncharacterized protein (UPF0335 family)
MTDKLSRDMIEGKVKLGKKQLAEEDGKPTPLSASQQSKLKKATEQLQSIITIVERCEETTKFMKKAISGMPSSGKSDITFDERDKILSAFTLLDQMNAMRVQGKGGLIDLIAQTLDLFAAVVPDSSTASTYKVPNRTFRT